ncbi:hypothetical protein [Verminephrobacter aporrectodeae]|uniref:hypothetical protein n=1 Tax=Verminephrobacter aporrectodeae TaxID=1110389 RepID=UPI00223876A8|nr:hypothetical protein [Verminephrobacter aporrectodeae]
MVLGQADRGDRNTRVEALALRGIGRCASGTAPVFLWVGRARPDAVGGSGIVGQKVVFGQPFHEAARIGCGLLYVIEVIG